MLPHRVNHNLKLVRKGLRVTKFMQHRPYGLTDSHFHHAFAQIRLIAQHREPPDKLVNGLFNLVFHFRPRRSGREICRSGTSAEIPLAI
jgi:hypothetical protein